jgi:hypothetical protein
MLLGGNVTGVSAGGRGVTVGGRAVEVGESSDEAVNVAGSALHPAEKNMIAVSRHRIQSILLVNILTYLSLANRGNNTHQ